jgi:hypothetical protein
MYTCERCGTGFARPSTVLESCPRCLARDGVRVALAPRLPEGGGGRSPRRLQGGFETAVRQVLSAGGPGAGRSRAEGAAAVRDAA